MPLFRDTPAFPKDPLFQAVLAVLLASALVSFVISLLADSQWNLPVLSEVAGFAALLSLVGYLIVRWLGIRAAKRDQQEAHSDDRED
ncbi:MAG: hypothetical protein AAFY02_10740 [Pseudomonadota bacterium]